MLRRELEELEALEPERKHAAPARRGTRVEEEEETTEERLTRRVGYLFPDGIPYEKIEDHDRHFVIKIWPPGWGYSE